MALATDDNNNSIINKVQYLKLSNGDSLITFCSPLDKGLYILYHPYVYKRVTKFNDNGTQTVAGNQLTRWIETNNQGPIPVPAREVLTKITPPDDEIEAYIAMVNKINRINEEADEERKIKVTKVKEEEAIGEVEEEPSNDHLSLVASNDNIVSKKSKAALDLVFDYEDEEESSNEEEDD